MIREDNSLRIRFAAGEEDKVLTSIFKEYRLALAGQTEEHVVLTGADGLILGGAMLSQWDSADFDLENTVFHIEVFGIAGHVSAMGFGSLLLEGLLSRPWEYCRRVYGAPNQESAPVDSFVVTTVSRGYAREFYKSCGFQECQISALPEYYHDQCADCAARQSCDPAPMIYYAK